MNPGRFKPLTAWIPSEETEDFPFLLGHETAGIGDAVGPGVAEPQPGDFIILNWRAVCGRCRAYRRGRPWYCFDTHNAPSA